ncbi:hypothetical protein ACH5RR_025033 [Cinchona calisaya]|uniref:Uncharacterized protein n=1 Tax=Cinchona calisaya TaxID=153742 RepID=A0ABD2YYH0_9GENT
MATTPSLIPDQDQQMQPQESVPDPQALSSTNSSAWHSSGSIGPFFAVISVLTVLSIISCYLGKICKGRCATPLESTKHGDRCLGWLRRKCSTYSNSNSNSNSNSDEGKAQEGV